MSCRAHGTSAAASALALAHTQMRNVRHVLAGSRASGEAINGGSAPHGRPSGHDSGPRAATNPPHNWVIYPRWKMTREAVRKLEFRDGEALAVALRMWTQQLKDGEIGCIASHRDAWQAAVDTGAKHVLVRFSSSFDYWDSLHQIRF